MIKKIFCKTYNFLFPGEEGVALETLGSVDSDEGKHVSEGGISWAVGDPAEKIEIFKNSLI